MFWKNYAKEWEMLSCEQREDRVVSALKKHLLSLMMFEKNRKFSPAEIKELQVAIVRTLLADKSIERFCQTLEEKLASEPRTKPENLLKDILGDFFWKLEEQGLSYYDLPAC